MGKKNVVNFDYTPAMREFYNAVKKTLVESPDYSGIGGHGVETHGPHGTHSQVSIRLGTGENKTIVNFRELSE